MYKSNNGLGVISNRFLFRHYFLYLVYNPIHLYLRHYNHCTSIILSNEMTSSILGIYKVGGCS